MSVHTIKRPGEVISHTLRARYEREIAASRAEMGGKIPIPTARGHEGEKVVMSKRKLAYLSQFEWGDVRPDPGILQRRIRRIQGALAAGAPDSYSPAAKLQLEKEAARLRGWLRKNMVPQSHSKIGYSHPDFRKAVAQGTKECLPDFQKKAGRYKSIMREIAPEDPDAANLERIRPKNA